MFDRLGVPRPILGQAAIAYSLCHITSLVALQTNKEA